MPRFDGTGPRGEGALTGRGEGYCIVQLPDPESGREAVGFAGLAGVPVRPAHPAAIFTPVTLPPLGAYPRRRFGRGRGRNAGRGHGRRFFMRRW